MEMTWLDKFKAIRALNPTNTCLVLRDGGTWYLSQRGVERKEGGCLSSGCDHGRTIDEAIQQHWEWITDPEYYVVIDAVGEHRRAVRWNGFMWEDVVEEKPC